ncbi:MAG TPA: hypothetical protein VFH73_07480 [Polyangia bacterium]|jgi:hypothetical protein|nr:hypothetical protein [Polyangia bacterium]
MTRERAGSRPLPTAGVIIVVLIVVAATVAVGCRRQDHLPPAPAVPAQAMPPAAAMQAPEPAPPPGPAAAPLPAVTESTAAVTVTDDGTPLLQDERDKNPRSETVTIKILAEPRRQARVFWGRKELGVAPLEVQRPRNSGPLELLVLAPDCLPLHTRVFTDRDDKLWLRLYRKEEAPQVLGYRLEPAAPPVKAR